MKRLLFSFLSVVALVPRAFAQNPSGAERFVGTAADVIAAEQTGWERVSLPVPAHITLEVSGILAVPGKRLLVTTRRGGIIVQKPRKLRGLSCDCSSLIADHFSHVMRGVYSH